MRIQFSNFIRRLKIKIFLRFNKISKQTNANSGWIVTWSISYVWNMKLISWYLVKISSVVLKTTWTVAKVFCGVNRQIWSWCILTTPGTYRKILCIFSNKFLSHTDAKTVISISSDFRPYGFACKTRCMTSRTKTNRIILIK